MTEIHGTECPDISGQWRLHVRFVCGEADHTMDIVQENESIGGHYSGTYLSGDIIGALNGSAIQFETTLIHHGDVMPYRFAGMLHGNEMTGEVHLGEYGNATWTAARV